jgi:lipoprotein-anchoring transpeptidase ErfK/SrfK
MPALPGSLPDSLPSAEHPKTRRRLTTGSLLLAGMAVALAGLLAPAPADAAGKKRKPLVRAAAATAAAGTAAASARPAGPGAEARLIEVYRLIAAGQGRPALERAERLVRDYPNFRLAHLVYGDLLLTQAGRLGEFGHVAKVGLSATLPAAAAGGGNGGANATMAANGASGASNVVYGGRTAEGAQTNGSGAPLTLVPATLPELRQEAELRVRALRERPPADATPVPFISLAPSTENALLVDLSRARLYHYRNSGGKLTLHADYYIAQGRAGADKLREGDQRTPLGVYYVTRLIERKKLDAFYGSGALPINFPNEYDRRRNRTGSGIWLHGVPDGDKGTYARAPRSSDGCVVLANDDLERLVREIKPGETPVVITDRALWAAPSAARIARDEFGALLERWQTARQQPQSDAFRNFYSAQFQSYGAGFDEWRRQQLSSWPSQPIHQPTLLYYPGHDELLVVTFYDHERRGKRQVAVKKRQYWHKVNGRWQIFFEGSLNV